MVADGRGSSGQTDRRLGGHTKPIKVDAGRIQAWPLSRRLLPLALPVCLPGYCPGYSLLTG